MSRGRELHAFGASDEEGRPEGFLQIGYALTYRGSDRVAAFRRPRDAAGVGHRNKMFEIAKVKVQVTVLFQAGRPVRGSMRTTGRPSAFHWLMPPAM